MPHIYALQMFWFISWLQLYLFTLPYQRIMFGEEMKMRHLNKQTCWDFSGEIQVSFKTFLVIEQPQMAILFCIELSERSV